MPRVGDILEPTGLVPEQFKQTARRAHKKLLKAMDPELLKAWNAFVTAFNSGVSGSALEETGDDLAEALDDARS